LLNTGQFSNGVDDLASHISSDTCQEILLQVHGDNTGIALQGTNECINFLPLLYNSLGHVLYGESGHLVVFDGTNNVHDGVFLKILERDFSKDMCLQVQGHQIFKIVRKTIYQNHRSSNSTFLIVLYLLVKGF
jgi:hypothetical protein